MATLREAMTIAMQHYGAGRHDLAGQICKQVLELAPHLNEVWDLYGVIAFQLGQYEQAEQRLGRAIALAPRSASAYNNLGVVLAGQKHFADAVTCFRQALEFNPDYAEARQNLHRSESQLRSYPKAIRPITLQGDLDFLLLNLPPMNMGELMPNGLGYVHNALLRAGVRCQTIDVNVHWYHAFYLRRILGRMPLSTADGYVLHDYLWGPMVHQEWERDEVFEYFRPEIDDLLEQIARGAPKAVGISVHASNREFSKKFIRELRRAAPATLVILGGYDCADPVAGPALYPDFDYMAIFEADLTIGPLATALARGERPKDLPGIVSRFDTPGRAWLPGPLLTDLDAVDFPRYQWMSLASYGVPGGSMPLMASRGCSWGRCRFCAECFPYRFRSPHKIADEIEEWTNRGAFDFHFYDSDVNGNPEALHDLCSEIIRRGLRVGLSAQIRVDKRSTPDYFQHLRKAGFHRLRFGVDGWTDHALSLQRKGYRLETVVANLRDCHAAGIGVGVNLVIGVPGETEADIDETIENIVANKDSVGAVEFINPLSLRTVSEYFRNAERYQIRFRKDKAAIVADRLYYVPDDLWYSEDPYIDWAVRVGRCRRIENGLRERGVTVGAHAQWVLAGVQQPDAYMDGFGEVRRRAPPASLQPSLPTVTPR
jgi:radical SAM superfamily enzyme YgiQ (UPF0313 family)